MIITWEHKSEKRTVLGRQLDPMQGRIPRKACPGRVGLLSLTPPPAHIPAGGMGHPQGTGHEHAGRGGSYLLSLGLWPSLGGPTVQQRHIKYRHINR